MAQIGPALRARRKAAGLTLREVARRSKLTHASLSRMERGGNCSLKTLVMAAHAIGCYIHVEMKPK